MTVRMRRRPELTREEQLRRSRKFVADNLMTICPQELEDWRQSINERARTLGLSPDSTCSSGELSNERWSPVSSSSRSLPGSSCGGSRPSLQRRDAQGDERYGSRSASTPSTAFCGMTCSFPLGIARTFRGETALPERSMDPRRWRARGRRHAASYRHFHDPLRPVGRCRAAAAPLAPRFDSSIVWMQKPQGWSWQEARSFFYTALTASRPEYARADVGRHLPRRRPGHAPDRRRRAAGSRAQRSARAGVYLSKRLSVSHVAETSNTGCRITAQAAAQPRRRNSIATSWIQATNHSEAPVPVARLHRHRHRLRRQQC